MNWLTAAKRKKIIAGVILAVLIGGGLYWYTSAARAPKRDVLVPITVTRGTVEALVTAQGKLEAKQYVDVGTQVSGQLKAIHVDIGDTVTKGQLLAEIDPRVYQAQVEAGEAKLNSLRAQLNQQKAEAVLAEQNLQAQPKPDRGQRRKPAGVAGNRIAGGGRQSASRFDRRADPGNRIQSQSEPHQSWLHQNLCAHRRHGNDACRPRKAKH